MVNRQVAFTLLLVCTVITPGLACRCPVPDRQTSFCKLDFSIKAQVVYKQTLPTQDRIYLVKILQQFKSTQSLGQYMIISTYQIGLCGVTMDLNDVFVLNGSFRPSQYGYGHVWTCEWNERWSSVPQNIRLQLPTASNTWC